jgi:hypothetical protein
MAAALVGRRAKFLNTQARIEEQRAEPVSFHLALLLGNDFTLQSVPDSVFKHGKSSVAVLRAPFQHTYNPVHRVPSSQVPKQKLAYKNSIVPIEGKPYNIARSKLEIWVKKACKKGWHEKLLIVTERRIFIISKREREQPLTPASGDASSNAYVPETAIFEIVDSIPMEEIVSIQFIQPESSFREDNPPSSPSRPNKLIERILAPMLALMDSLLQRLVGDASEDTPHWHACKQELHDSSASKHDELLSVPMPDDADAYFSKVLRITTVPSGFNYGQPYHLLLKQGPYPYFMTRNEIETRCLYGPDDGAQFERKLARLVGKHRDAFLRRTRFTRLQQDLQKASGDRVTEREWAGAGGEGKREREGEKGERW